MQRDRAVISRMALSRCKRDLRFTHHDLIDKTIVFCYLSHDRYSRNHALRGYAGWTLRVRLGRGASSRHSAGDRRNEHVLSRLISQNNSTFDKYNHKCHLHGGVMFLYQRPQLAPPGNFGQEGVAQRGIRNID